MGRSKGEDVRSKGAERGSTQVNSQRKLSIFKADQHQQKTLQA